MAIAQSKKTITRRTFLHASAGLVGTALTPAWPTQVLASLTEPRDRPSIFLSAAKRPGLRSLAEVREATRTGRAAEMWSTIVETARNDLQAEPLTPGSMFTGRSANAAKHNNPDYTICRAAGQRILRCALTNLLTGRVEYKQAAMLQMQALFDPLVWPEWMDQSHRRFGHP
ncbi:hypothetical protein MJD09_09345, partial [bacterium]|nr:hypothetical protein [bacterium]